MKANRLIILNKQKKIKSVRLYNRTSKSIYYTYLECIRNFNMRIFNDIIFQRALALTGGIQSLMFSNLFIDKKVIKGIFSSDFFSKNDLGEVGVVRGRIENLRTYHPRRRQKLSTYIFWLYRERY